MGNLFNKKYMEEDINLRVWRVKDEPFLNMHVQEIGGAGQNQYCFLR
jgi:hypothetical protein